MLPSAYESPTSTVPRRGSLRPLCRKRRAKRCPPGNRGGAVATAHPWQETLRATSHGLTPGERAPRVLPYRSAAWLLKCWNRPSFGRGRQLSTGWFDAGSRYTDFCWRDGGILTPVIPLTHLHKICIICVRKSASGWLIVKNRLKNTHLAKKFPQTIAKQKKKV